jgi:hypothetical protein
VSTSQPSADVSDAEAPTVLDWARAQQPAVGTRYVGLAVIPRRRRAIERALGRIVQLGGEALLITADGSSKPRWPGVEHIDLLNDEMHFGANRAIAVSPKRVVGKLMGRKVGGRSLAWRLWSDSRAYKAGRYYLLWHVLRRRLDEVGVDRVTKLLLAGVESWPIAWHLAKLNSTLEMGWDVPDAWQRPVELEPLGRKRIAVWGGNPSWHVLTQGGEHRADEVFTFSASSWIAQAGPAADVSDLVSDGDSFEERVVREDLSSKLITGIIEAQPDAVLLDVLGELNQIAHVGQWCTLSEFTAAEGLDPTIKERADRVSDWDDPERLAMFTAAARRVADQLLSGLPEATFVLHRLQLPLRKDRLGNLDASGRQADLTKVNALLQTYEKIVMDLFGDRLKVLEVPAQLRRPGKPHPSGVVQSGFSSAYSEAALGLLDDIVRGDA